MSTVGFFFYVHRKDIITPQVYVGNIFFLTLIKDTF